MRRWRAARRRRRAKLGCDVLGHDLEATASTAWRKIQDFGQILEDPAADRRGLELFVRYVAVLARIARKPRRRRAAMPYRGRCRNTSVTPIRLASAQAM